MAENSGISWTDNTFNPWMGCTKVSPACQHCYAERDMDHRYGKVAWGPSGTRVKTSTANWNKPLKWNREAIAAGKRLLVFCASLADVFEDWEGPIVDSDGAALWVAPVEPDRYVPWRNNLTPQEQANLDAGVYRPATMKDLRASLFRLIDKTPWLDWLLLTKRPENVERMWPAYFPGGYIAEAGSMNQEGPRPNVILGTSIENQEWTDKRLPHLHAAKRRGLVSRTFVSAEPLLGPVMLHGEANGLVHNHLGECGVDWVIAGGESGPNARPSKPEWFRSLRDQCEAVGVPFHFKQWGEFDAHENRVGVKLAGRELDGRTYDGLPIVASA